MAHAIFLQNVALIEKSAIVLANIVPFRGPSADPGTVWEIGYAYAKGIPVICYGSAGTYLERCRAAGLDLRHTKGMGYNPLTRRYSLNSDTSVNYLFATQRPLA